MTTATIDIEKLFSAYIEAALWSSTDDDDKPLDANYSADDIAPETLKAMRDDCEKFFRENTVDIATWSGGRYSAEEMAGHDFWLTRCGHGAGFWDGDWDSEVGERLTDKSHAFGEVSLYVGDDGLIYS